METKFTMRLEKLTKKQESLVEGIPKTRLAYKKKLSQIPSEIKQIIVGVMLGDCYADRKTINHNTRLVFGQGGEKRKNYAYWLQNIFQVYVRTGITPKSTRFNTFSYRFTTLSLPGFNWIRETFYDKNGVKVIPTNIDILLSPIGLAFWFMDDGSKSGSGYHLATHGFSLEETIKLSKLLNTKFKLLAKPKKEEKKSKGKTYYLVRISGKSQVIFTNLVKPYLHISMYYKLH